MSTLRNHQKHQDQWTIVRHIASLTKNLQLEKKRKIKKKNFKREKRKIKKKSSKNQINNKIGQSQKYQPGATFYTRNNSTPSRGSTTVRIWDTRNNGYKKSTSLGNLNSSQQLQTSTSLGTLNSCNKICTNLSTNFCDYTGNFCHSLCKQQEEKRRLPV